MYSLSPVSANSTARVARPTNTGRTPVAIGSSVPAWPTRRSFKIPRSLAQTSILVQSCSLSMMMIPLGMVHLLLLCPAGHDAFLYPAGTIIF